ncbi:MAG: hypothetical protein JRM83_08355 [Nitrososphaerota archaeon]|nr:hypothetical protein [Nitrososphaerota archaeon]
MSACIFFSLVLGNYLVFSPDRAVQQWGTDFLIPVYFLSVYVLRIVPFDEGMWAFTAFCVLLLSLAALRTRSAGLGRAVVDSLTLIGPGILVFFETGVYFLIPGYFYSQVTNFIGRAGVGGIFTNEMVLLSSATLLMLRLCISVYLNGWVRLGHS